MSSLREKILNADDRRSEQVDVPEWGVTVEVRGLSGADRAAFLADAVTDEGKVDFTRVWPSLLIAGVYDPESGEPVFQAADRDAINAKSAGVTERLAKIVQRLSGLDEDAVAQGKGGSGKSRKPASS